MTAQKEKEATWINSASDTSSKRVPRFRVEPVPEAIQPFSSNVLSSSVVEPGIELMDNTLISDNLLYN